MVQLPSLGWVVNLKPRGFLLERMGVNSSTESISPVIFHLELELLSLKVKGKPEKPPPSCHDSEVHASVAVGVSAGPDFPALGVAAAVFMLIANRQSSSATMQTQLFGLFRHCFLVSRLQLKLLKL